mmetsp:Transcript_10866/g.44489  ORF Transcript_10866/g.44489 Transcript_10866/m.44489 type:complete len:937 (+) Transcript_10866:52-2862(+)
MSSKSKKQRKKQAAALAAASAFGSGLNEEVPERGARRNQAIGHGAITIQPDLLEMHAKKRKSSSGLSRSKVGSKTRAKSSTNAPVATMLSKKTGIELVSSSVLLQVQLSNGTSKRIRFELKDTVAQCLKHVLKHDKELTGQLFAVSGGIWLEDDRTLGSYNLEEMESIEVRAKPPAEELLTIRVMVPHDATLDSLSIDPDLTTARGILQSIHNKPKTFDLDSSAVFFQRSGVWLDNNSPASNYDLKENDTLIYGERSKKKISGGKEGRNKGDVPPLMSSMSEACISIDAKPGRATSTGRRLPRGTSMDMLKAAAVGRANSSEAPELASSVNFQETEEKKATFAEPENEVRISVDDSDMGERVTTSVRNRRAMSLSMDAPHKLVRPITRTPADASSQEEALNISVLVASKQKRVVISVNSSDTVADAEQQVLAEMGKVASELSDCRLFHPRNMQEMESMATLASFDLKDEDLLVFKEEQKTEEKKSEKGSGKGKGFFHRIRTSSKKESSSPPSSPSQVRRAVPAEAAPLLLNHKIVKLYLQALKKLSAEKEEGIFRISGNAAQVKEMREDIRTKGAKVSFEGIDYHELAGGLKYYFRDIEEPVVPYEFYEKFLETHSGSEIDADRLKELVAELPDEHRKSLAMTVGYLCSVTALAETNFMSADNVGIVFGPTLIRNPGESIDLAKTGVLADLVAFMVSHPNDIFVASELLFSSEESEEATEESETAGDAPAELGTEGVTPTVENEEAAASAAAGNDASAVDDEEEAEEDEGSDDSYDESGGDDGASSTTATPRTEDVKEGQGGDRTAAEADLHLAKRDDEEDEDEDEEEDAEHESDEEGERDADVAALALAVAVAVQEQECPVAEFEDVTPRTEETIDSQLDAVIFNLTVSPAEGAKLLLKMLKDPEKSMELADSKSKLELLNLLEAVSESLAATDA